jgi:hypothetical protein
MNVGPEVSASSDSKVNEVANAIASAINNSTQVDPVSQRVLGSVVQASVESVQFNVSAVVRITARDPAFRFTVACSVLPEGGDVAFDYSQDGPFQAPQTATVAGTITAGSLLTTVIDGIAIPYTAVAGDTAATIASNIAKAINATSTPDPDTKLPLNQILSASADGGVIAFTPQGSFAFTVACSLLAAPPATYTAGRQPSPFADDGYGNFLQDKSQTLFGHEPTLRAAFSLTGAIP